MLRNLNAAFPELRFHSGTADVEAIRLGDPTLLRPDLDEPVASLPDPPREAALVFGGNGFVGAHLIARLARDPRIRRVWATVRGSATQSPRQRLEETVHRYEIGDIPWQKVDLVEATPTRDGLGLPVDRYQELVAEVDLVFNCASSSDYSTSYLDLRTDWVLSLPRLLRFCVEGRRKHLTYLGSVSSYFYQQPEDFQRPDSWWYSGYAQMKWVNGTLLRWLAKDGLLPVTLVEAPYVLGATDVARDPAQHYSWWRIIEVARSIGLLWDGPGMCYIPVDVLVDALTENALREAPLPRLLPRNPVPYHNDLLAELLRVELTSWDEFLAEATRQVSARRVNTLLSSNFDALVRIVNKPPTIFPPGYDDSWCDNRRLHSRYLENIQLRDVRVAARPASAPSSV